MTDTGSERSHPPIPYGGNYQQAENFEAPQPQRSRAVGGYPQLEGLVSGSGALGLSRNDVLRVEAALMQLTASDKQSLSNAVGAYLGDALCSMHANVWWESLGAETPIVRLSPKVTWDVFTYVENRVNDSADFMSTGLTEMERLLAVQN